MGKFASSKTQAASVIKNLQGNVIKSVGSVRNYEQSLTLASKYMKENNLGSLRDATKEDVNNLLNIAAADKSQSQVDMLRQSIQLMMQHVTNKLSTNETLKRVLSENPTKLTGRGYKSNQVGLIIERQTDKYNLSTRICYESGSRAHEIFTLRPINEQPPDDRPASDKKWQGRESGIAYTITGKGGLTREIRIPQSISTKLEERRLDTPRIIIDRGVRYVQHYDIGGGKGLSASFSAASQRALGWSTGVHGTRHSYAQERMHELQSTGLSRKEALHVVSQELGHFRPSITEVYLR